MSFNVLSFLKSGLANLGAVPVADNNPLPVTASPSSSSGTQTSVAASASDVTILAANPARKRATILNDSASATLYLLFASGTSSTTNYSVQLLPGSAWLEDQYTGVIKGIWSAASGNARVTENT